MKRFWKAIGLGSVCAFAGCSGSNQLDNQPNVLFIVADDLGYADLSCAALAPDVNTPNIDALANTGVRFTNAYVTSSISSPSRAGLITGCYQQQWGTFWYGGKGIHDTAYQTIPEVLIENGYQTGYVGKVHYGDYDRDTSNRSFPLNHGFEYFYGHTSPRKHYINHVQALEDSFQNDKRKYQRQGQSLRQEPLWDNYKKVDTIGFLTDIIASKACEFIDDNDDPFFLQVAFNAVHNFTHQLPEAYLQEHGLNGYHDWDPCTEDYYEWYQKGRKPNNSEGRAHYLGQLHYLDNAIGEIMSCLQMNKIADNTIVVFISDNGGSTPIYADNTPLRGSKYLLYEGGIRVPMIISYPEKFRSNVVVNNMVSAMDILPTICANTESPIPVYTDGMDISALLNGEDELLAHDTLYWDSGHEFAVRAGKWKLFISNSDWNAKYEMVEVELGEALYDLENDPGETTNLAEKYPEVLEKLKLAHQRWKDGL